MHNSVEEMWRAFESKVVPEEATEIQRGEMQRSFYAGALSIMDFQHEVCSVEQLTEEQIYSYWDGFYQEIIQFFHEVISDEPVPPGVLKH